MTRIYADYAATAPLRPEALAALHALLGASPANPSSLHAEGRAAHAVLDDARVRIARVLGAKPREIVFTGSGSEADNLAILGTARATAARGRHLVSARTEHHAVLHALERLADDGWAVTLLDVDADGRVDPAAFSAALRPETTLATIMLANNEIGTLAPVAELARIARGRGVVFHTDAVQAPCTQRLDVAALGVDLLALAAHKFGGPPGVGVLYARGGTPLAPLVLGGAQEYGRHAGTENVAAIAATAAALEPTQAEAPAEAARLDALRRRFETGLLATLADVRINAAGAARLPGITSAVFGGARADVLLIALDLAGIAASSGSACAAGSTEPSHVIASLGLSEQDRASVIRFSFGRSTTQAEIDELLERLPGVVAETRCALPVV